MQGARQPVRCVQDTSSRAQDRPATATPCWLLEPGTGDSNRTVVSEIQMIGCSTDESLRDGLEAEAAAAAAVAVAGGSGPREGRVSLPSAPWTEEGAAGEGCAQRPRRVSTPVRLCSVCCLILTEVGLGKGFQTFNPC